MYFPLELPLGKHIPLYGSIPGRSFRLRHHPETTSQSERGFRDGLSAWAAIGKACPGLRCQGVFFTAAPCIEFDSPRFGESVDGLRPGQDARSASHLYLAGALRGESAYLLRKSAPASAACRRPRPLATNASRLLNARALHRVRFSAVRTRNKKAGRYNGCPAFAQIKPAKIYLSLFGRLLGALEGADHVDLVERSIGGKVDDKRKGKGQQHG